MFDSCKHDWKVLVKELSETNLDKMKKHDLYPSKYFPSDLEQTLVVICSCKKCGELKKFVEKF